MLQVGSWGRSWDPGVTMPRRASHSNAPCAADDTSASGPDAKQQMCCAVSRTLCPSTTLLCYLIARGAWPGHSERKADQWEFVHAPPTSDEEWRRTVETVLAARPRPWTGVHQQPMFVMSAPSTAACQPLSSSQAAGVMKALAGAAGRNPKLVRKLLQRVVLAALERHGRVGDGMAVLCMCVQQQQQLVWHIDFGTVLSALCHLPHC